MPAIATGSFTRNSGETMREFNRRSAAAKILLSLLAAAVALGASIATAKATERERAAYLLLAMKMAEKNRIAANDSGGGEKSPGGTSAAKNAAGATNAPDAATRFNGKPYKLYPDGKVNFATYRGYNLYASVCHVCHGHAGLGSSFAPSLVDSLKYMNYEDFVSVVMNGRQNITSATTNVMPSFGDNPSIVKYIDSIYAYLKARSDGAIGDGDVLWEGPKDQ